MSILVTIAAAYVALGFIRAIYRLATGFFYVSPEGVSSNRYYHPRVSVIIPAWNEEVGIRRTLDSVINNGYSQTQIIVVDDGSTDNTAKSVSQYAKQYSNVQLISQPNGGKSSALNTGIAAAKGSLILTLDADSFLEPGSIKKMVGALANKQYSVAIGEVVVGNTKTWLGLAQHFEYSVGFHVKRGQHVFDSAYIFPGALTMFRAQVLKEIGEFTHYSSTEDLDISMRIKAAGHKIAYVDSAFCITEGASTLKGILNQRTRWRHGYLECLLHRRDFLVTSKKGWYLTLVDLPLQLFGVLETLLFPFILAMLGYLITLHVNPLALAMAYCIVPFTLIMLNDMRGQNHGSILWAFAMPPMLIVIEAIEHIALLKSIYRTIRRQRTTWTVWQRTGATS